jgi:hypothetical protein
LIENTNGRIRKLMGDLFVRTNTMNWIDHLQEIVDSINSSVHSVTKKAPKDIWKPELNRDLDEKELEVKTKLDDKAKENITKSKSQILRVNDCVRIALNAIQTNVRKEIKSGNAKKIIVKYTPILYYVKKVIRPTGIKRDFQQNRYVLRDIDDFEVWDDNNRAYKFYASDLQKVDPASAHLINTADGDRLNKI